MSQFRPPQPEYTNLQHYQQPSLQQEPQSQTGYPQWQYPSAPQVSAQLPNQPVMPQATQPAKRPSTKSFLIMLGIVALIVLGFGLGYLREQNALSDLSGSSPHNAGMSEQQYKDSTITTTVANLDKEGNQYSGKDVHFTATLLNFVKDSSGNTGGANVSDPATFTSIIQVVFPAGTDLSQLNTQDQIEVWGTDEGTFTGTNAFGATVHEVGISALYLTDHTTGYNDG